MRKLGLRFILPAAQLALALILLYWGNHTKAPPHSDTPFTPSVTLICFGINAPALLLLTLGAWLGTPRMDKAPVMLSGFGLDEPQGSLKTGQSGSLQNRPTVRARDIDVDGSPYRLSRHEQRLERRKETASHRTGKARLVFTKDRARNRCTA